MLTRNLILAATLFLSTQASVIPSDLSISRRTEDSVSDSPLALESRCDCDEDENTWGGGHGATTSVGASIGVSLKTFTDVQLGYLSSAIGVFANVDVDVKATVHAVIGAGVNVVGWSETDLASLSSALVVYAGAQAHGGASASLGIFIQAGIDVSSFTAVQAGCLHDLIDTCITANVDLAVSEKTTLLHWCSSTVSSSQIAIVDLSAQISAALKAVVSVGVGASGSAATGVSTGTSSTTSTSVDLAAQLKVQLRTYIQSCMDSGDLLDIAINAKLSLLLQIMDAWISGNWNVLSGVEATLLGIKLTAVSDVTICNSILAFLLKLSVKFNAMAALKLNLSVLSSVVA